MGLLDLANVLQAFAAVTAAALAWKRRSYMPVALLLTSVVIADWTRLGLDRSILASAPVPYTGLARAAFHTEQALFLVWPAGVAALADWVFRGRGPWDIVLAYSAAVVSLAISYPWVRQDLLARAYLVIHLVAFGFALMCIAQQLFKSAPNIERAALLFSTLISLAALLGPYTGHDWIGRWRFAQFANAVLYAILTYLQGIRLWTRSRSSAS